MTLEPPRRSSVRPGSGLFERVIGASSGYSWLPVAELMTVVSGKDASDRFIGGAVDRQSETVGLVRGNLATLVVPFTFFTVSGDTSGRADRPRIRSARSATAQRNSLGANSLR